MIPADWKEVRLGECASFFKGNGLSKSQLIDDGPQKCVHYGELFSNYGPVIQTVTNACIPFDGSFKSQQGDVLMPGSDVTPRGLATASSIQVSDVILGGDVIVIRPERSSLHGPFLSNLIRVSKSSILRLVKGSTVYHIHAKDLSDFELLKPPLKEQEAIAEALSDADAAIESLNALISKKRDVKQAAMQQLLTGRTRLPGFTADWKEVRLGECASFFKGNGLSKSQLIDDGPQKCVHYGELFSNYGPVIQTVTNACIPFDGSFKSQQGDVLMPGSDVTPRGLATASSIQVSDVILGGDVIVIRPERSSLHGPFLSNLIRVSKSSILRLVKGSTVYHIHAKDLSDFELLKPPLKEQEAIAEALNVIDDEMEALTKQMTKLRMVKEGMMQDLLTGKVRLA